MLSGKTQVLALLLSLSMLVCASTTSTFARSKMPSFFSGGYGRGDRRIQAIYAYNEGVELFRQNRAPEAIAKFRTVLQLDPSQQAAHAPLGQLLFSSGQYEDALSELSAAVAFNYSDSTCWCLLGVTSARLHRYDQTVNAFQRYLAMEPYGMYASEARRSIAILQKTVFHGEDSDNDSNYMRDFVGTPRKWRSDRGPLRVYIADGSQVPLFRPVYYDIVRGALSDWTTMSNGRIRFELVDDPSKAQVCCSWTANPGDLTAAGELGTTELRFNSRGEIDHATIKLFTKFNDAHTPQDVERRAQAVALHEFGHALGLQHSQKPWDIMYPTVAPLGLEFSLGIRDRNTLLTLYHS